PPPAANGRPARTPAFPARAARAPVRKRGRCHLRNRYHVYYPGGSHPGVDVAALQGTPMTSTVTVATPGGTYPIAIGPGLLASLAAHMPAAATALALV